MVVPSKVAASTTGLTVCTVPVPSCASREVAKFASPRSTRYVVVFVPMRMAASPVALPLPTVSANRLLVVWPGRTTMAAVHGVFTPSAQLYAAAVVQTSRLLLMVIASRAPMPPTTCAGADASLANT